MPTPVPSMGAKVIVQDLPSMKGFPGTVISSTQEGVATVGVFTDSGYKVLEDVPWDNTTDKEPSPDKCWRYNWATP